jgi:hypothetical protein
LRQFLTGTSSIPEWLFDECYLAVGDLAEAISLILPPSEYQRNVGLALWMESRILPCRRVTARASRYTDYTFTVWSDGPGSEPKIVPFAKAYSGLTDGEIAQLDAIIRKTTVEKFGPVRSVTPAMVFEIGFEGITGSSRHKSGIAVRFPRMLRIRLDKKIDEADTLDT